MLHLGCVSPSDATIAVHCFDKDSYDSDDSLLDEHLYGGTYANGEQIRLGGSSWVEVAPRWPSPPPTALPTVSPWPTTAEPTGIPTRAPTAEPTEAPTTAAPTAAPSVSQAPTSLAPTAAPTAAPPPPPTPPPTTAAPTRAPHAAKRRKVRASGASAGLVAALVVLAAGALGGGAFVAKAIYDTRRRGVYDAAAGDIDAEGFELATVEGVRSGPPKFQNFV